MVLNPVPRTSLAPVASLVFIASVVSLASLALPATASAQYPDAWVIPRGLLRLSFEPRYINASQRFDLDGNVEPRGTDLSDDSAGVRLIPTLFNPQGAIWSITGDSSQTVNAGAILTTLEADVRRFPFNFHLGITDRLTLTVSMPLVTTRSQANIAVDTTTGNLGWNQAAPDAGNAGATAQIQLLLAELEAAAASVEVQIAMNGYDCPAGPTCDQARDLVLRTRRLHTDLELLTGVSGSGAAAAVVPPFAPLGSSPTGQAVTAAIGAIITELQSLGASAVTATLPLPGVPVTADNVNTMLSNPVYGYDADPIVPVKFRRKFGDAEVGLRYGIAQGPKLRTVLATTVRLPTGSRDAANNYVDIGTGQRQTDIELRMESVWMPGSHLALAFDATYTLQLGDQLVRRITPHQRPLATLFSETTVRRNLGDVLRLGIYPSLRLTEGVTAYASASYFHKQRDRFTLTPDISVPPELGGPVTVSDLEEGTQWRSLSFGGGVYYRMVRGRHERSLPIEAGVDYRAVFSGSGGLAPKTASVNFFLRLYLRLFGGPPEEPSEEQP